METTTTVGTTTAMKQRVVHLCWGRVMPEMIPTSLWVVRYMELAHGGAGHCGLGL
uniref:Uncharacterized protein n=1 Tax=Helianthus annuus TaxID=4232 RepID=A0A251TBE6_HELAN